jgi:hypothetical protein
MGTVPLQIHQLMATWHAGVMAAAAVHAVKKQSSEDDCMIGRILAELHLQVT